MLPDRLRDQHGRSLCKRGIGHSKFYEPKLIDDFVTWTRSLGVCDFQGVPHEWLTLRRGTP
jgi:hypothetical protein